MTSHYMTYNINTITSGGSNVSFFYFGGVDPDPECGCPCSGKNLGGG